MTKAYVDRHAYDLLLSLLPPCVTSPTAYFTSIGYDVEVAEDLDEGEDDDS